MPILLRRDKNALHSLKALSLLVMTHLRFLLSQLGMAMLSTRSFPSILDLYPRQTRIHHTVPKFVDVPVISAVLFRPVRFVACA